MFWFPFQSHVIVDEVNFKSIILSDDIFPLMSCFLFKTKFCFMCEVCLVAWNIDISFFFLFLIGNIDISFQQAFCYILHAIVDYL